MIDPDPGRRLASQIRRAGPIPFADFHQTAIDAFFAAGRGAGRSGRDFVTSPEVGSLFGTLLARALDDAWRRLRHSDPFVLVDAGGGRGRLLADVLRAHPACSTALHAVLVERSDRLRDDARAILDLEPSAEALGPFARDALDEPAEPVRRSGPVVTALRDLPLVALTGIVVANELLDNLPVRLVERRDDRWCEVRVALAADEVRFVELLVDASSELARDADDLAAGTLVRPGDRLPVPAVAAGWLTRVAATLPRGELWIIDYADETAGLLARGPTGPGGWLRTYRDHGRGTSPLDAPGDQDITCDLPLGWLRHATRRAGFAVEHETTQADWLRQWGLDDLVAAGRARWDAGAHRGDLDAISGRSITLEAAALTDPAGLGAHRVLVLRRG
jgi:NADH dehydrogenase [ubiquinone] 1 alpha subcomplex assembly factor 7